MLRERLERETGPVCNRVREAIAVANNEIHRLASMRPEWDGMACVLTVAVVKDGMATIGHVGDTRLYKVRDGHIEKITTITHRSVNARTRARSLNDTRCAIRGVMRCIATSAQSLMPRTIPSSSTCSRSRSIPVTRFCCAATA